MTYVIARSANRDGRPGSLRQFRDRGRSGVHSRRRPSAFPPFGPFSGRPSTVKIAGASISSIWPGRALRARAAVAIRRDLPGCRPARDLPGRVPSQQLAPTPVALSSWLPAAVRRPENCGSVAVQIPDPWGRSSIGARRELHRRRLDQRRRRHDHETPATIGPLAELTVGRVFRRFAVANGADRRRWAELQLIVPFRSVASNIDALGGWWSF